MTRTFLNQKVNQYGDGEGKTLVDIEHDDDAAILEDNRDMKFDSPNDEGT